MQNDNLRHISIILTLSTLLTASCNSQTEPAYDKEAIAFNNQAVEIMLNDPDSALTLLNRATDIDKDYYVAYNNKVSIYCSKGEYVKAIEASKQGLKSKPDLAEAVVMLGMLYDYTGQPDKAKEQYQKAIELFDDRLTRSDKNREANRLNRAHALLLLGNEPEGQKEVQALLKEDPDNFALQMLVDFDKDEYLNEILRRKNE